MMKPRFVLLTIWAEKKSESLSYRKSSSFSFFITTSSQSVFGTYVSILDNSGYPSGTHFRHVKFVSTLPQDIPKVSLICRIFFHFFVDGYSSPDQPLNRSTKIFGIFSGRSSYFFVFNPFSPSFDLSYPFQNNKFCSIMVKNGL